MRIIKKTLAGLLIMIMIVTSVTGSNLHTLTAFAEESAGTEESVGSETDAEEDAGISGQPSELDGTGGDTGASGPEGDGAGESRTSGEGGDALQGSSSDEEAAVREEQSTENLGGENKSTEEVNMGGGIPGVRLLRAGNGNGNSSSQKTMTFNISAADVEIAYIEWNKNQYPSSELQPLANGQQLSIQYRREDTEFIVFFVKPVGDALLTGLKATGGQLYPIDEFAVNHNGYTYINDVIAQGKAAGYVAAFGYTLNAGQRDSADVTVTGLKPGLSVTAESDKTENVEAGETVSFSVTVTPAGADSVTTSLSNVQATINGTPVNIEGLAKQTDGSWKGTVGYTVTSEDAGKGNVTFAVNAKVKYDNVLSLSGGDVATSMEKEVSATVQVSLIQTLSGEVTLTAGSADKVYDGKPLTCSDYTVDGLPAGYSAEAVTSGEQTDAGESENVITSYVIKDAQDTDVTDRFTNVKTVPGTLTVTKNVTPITVTITGNEEEKVYNGAWQTVTGYDYTVTDAEKSAVTVTAKDGAAQVSGKDVGPYTMELSPEDFVVTSQNYGNITVSTQPGSLMITPAELYVKTEDAQKPYDGEPLTNPSARIVGLADGETAAVKASGSQTKVGSSRNTYKEEDIDWGNTDPANYVLNAEKDDLGLLTVTKNDTPITVTIKGRTGSDVYDGQAHTVTGYDVDITGSDLYTEDDFVFSPEAGFPVNADGEPYATQTEVGTAYMELSANQFANISEIFTDVTFVVEQDGSQEVEILDVTVTVTGAQATDPYDGEVHTATGYSVTDVVITATEEATTLYDVNDIVFTAQGEPGTDAVSTNADGEPYASRKDAGKTVMGLTEWNFENINPNFNVAFDIVDGYQEIKPITSPVTVTITGNNHTARYDGQTHTVSGYTASADHPLYDVKAYFSFMPEALVTTDADGVPYASRTEAGTTWMNLVPEQFANTNANFTNVTFAVTDGFQTVTAPEEIALTASGITKAYNGQPHGGTVTVTPADAKVEYSTDGGETWTEQAPVRTDAGTTDVLVRATHPNAVKEATASYKITVTPRRLGIIASDETSIYTGKPITQTRWRQYNYTVLGGHTVSGVTNKSNAVDVGVHDNVPSGATVRDAEGNDVTDNYAITYYNGKITVTPRNLEITLDDKTKMYGTADPAPLSYRRDTGGGAGVAPADTLIANSELLYIRQEGEDVGEYPITLEAIGSKDHTGSDKGIRIIGADDRDVTGNYIITVVPGKLTITRSSQSLTITADELVEFTYDGTMHYGNVTVSDENGNVPAGTQMEFSYANTRKGADANEIKTVDYALWQRGGKLERQPYRLSAGRFVVKVRATHPNYTESDWVYYTIRVNRRPLMITIDDNQSKVYGEDDPPEFTYTVQKDTDDGVADAGLLTGLGHRFETTPVAMRQKSGADPETQYEAYWETEQAGQYPITIDGVKILGYYDGDPDDDLTHNYDIQFNEAFFTIEKRNLTISIDDLSIPLNEISDLEERITYHVDGLLGEVNDDKHEDVFQDGTGTSNKNVRFVVSGETPDAPGEYTITAEYVIDEEHAVQRNPFVGDCYTFTVTAGKLTVTPPPAEPPYIPPYTPPGYTPPATPPDTPATPPADAPGVLGAVRDEPAAVITAATVADGQAVLGARRNAAEAATGGRTADTGEASDAYRWMTIFGCLAAMFLLTADKTILSLSDLRRARLRARRNTQKK